MAEGTNVRSFGNDRLLAQATIDAYQVLQVPSGLAAVLDNRSPVSSGSYTDDLITAGQFTLIKSTGFVALAGGRAFWDHSANAVSYKKTHDRDFYLGVFAEDAISQAASCVVDLNVQPRRDLDLLRDAALSVLVGTPAAGGFGYPVSLGGARIFELTSTSEAQKVDLFGIEGFDRSAKAIVEIAFRVISDGAGSEPDASLGIANETHASDADSIAQSLFVHLNGNDVNIYLESDDGSTEVAATDTTIDYTEGGELTSRVEVWFDLRSDADIQAYVNGSNVLPSSVFRLDAAAGPLRPIIHLEKTSSASVYKLAIDRLEVRFAEQRVA